MHNEDNRPIGRIIVKISNTIHKVLGPEQTSRNSSWLALLPNDQLPLELYLVHELVWIHSISLLSKCCDSKAKKAMIKSFPLLFPRFLGHVVFVNHSVGPRVKVCVLLPTEASSLQAAKETRQPWFASRYSFNVGTAHNWMFCYAGLSYQTVKGIQGSGEIATNYRRHLPGLIAFVFNCMLIISSARPLLKRNNKVTAKKERHCLSIHVSLRGQFTKLKDLKTNCTWMPSGDIAGMVA